MIILFVFVLNLVISIFNAWGCGKTWNETRHVGGWPHLLNWSGAIMSACGFTWCYMVVFGLIGTIIPITDEETNETHMLLTPDRLEAFFQLGYLVIIGPIIGSGLAITVDSWRRYRESRSARDGAIASYNTFAMLYDIGHAVRDVPWALDGVSGLFSSKGSGSSSSKDGKAMIIILLVAAALLAGVLTTAWIIRTTASSTLSARRWQRTAVAPRRL